VQTAFVQLVNHKSNDPIVAFGNHANTISLPQTAYKIIFAPSKLKVRIFDLKDFGHISPNHPTHM
jgi:hypothetical protein